ncbi:MAG: tRNA 2-selenouridine(34) synthase MnmH [Comamonadaceae bacterium CG_4_9_14_3_um_filter_60_33]|nr:MAG: tRNA 2-selenouridine(34) synthase MnmH [Comamonadaceae bacterium CG2_30_59_20]PIY29606.1 MAG: tRNA 2-selenouridine(34) synthase MnmH [Comamonadaceae bacterium CG_4_10_14_3_um_filter_60_42]PJB46450.1 MAG: tRNA 2-selenouridine(34) synthase MnmH [Comamonadaceae bacterium CG_4_9_14_3_um_filter_60_33]
MSLTPLCATEVITRLADFDAIIDARSEAEYLEDHLPGAINWPTLNNAERIEIGTLYKQVNPFEARKRGAAIAARNIASHIEREVIDKPRDWQPLAYCWRGGQRSGSLALILSQIGFRVTLVEGGYKAFRAALVQDILARVPGLSFRVICGPTGSGKTRLLQALAAQGAQVLDLEALANHRSSVLGAMPGLAQPTQKRFDTLIWDRLRSFDAAVPVYVESESKKVGNLSVPAALIEAMRASPCLNLQLPDAERVALLLEDYDYLTRDVDYFCNRLSALVEIRSRAVVEHWQAQARSGQFAEVVLELLQQHYDPAYLQSMQRNFVQFSQAGQLTPTDRSAQAMNTLASRMLV